MNLTQVPISMIDTASGDAGKVLTSNGSTLSWTASGSLTSGTAVTLTNQTSVDFTGIPSTAKRITVMFSGVSTTGVSLPTFRLGAGSITTSGYLGSGSSFGTIVETSLISTGFPFTASGWAATSVMHGSYVFMHVGSNMWVCRGINGSSNSYGSFLVSGSIALAGTLDRVRLTTANGTDTFDAGTVNIMWE